MHIDFLLEEQSAEAALRILIPRMTPKTTTFECYAYNGKSDLLRKLPDRLRAYRKWMPDDQRIVVLIDADQQDCHQLKDKLQGIASQAGLRTSSAAQPNQHIQVVNRIAVEELEAWFFGDIEALAAAYPGIPTSLDKQKKYRDPDAISGGTWEALERVLQAAGYHRGGPAKIEAAKDIAVQMEPGRNRSTSFQMFRNALIQICS